jgi:hypothetical protein
MGGWFRQIALKAQVRAGLSAGIAIWAAVAVVALPVAFIFLLLAAFLWLSHRYGAVIAGLILGAAFLALALMAILGCVMARRRNIERARHELEMRRDAASAQATLLNPKLMAMGLGRAIGWRRLAPLAIVALIAAGLAREWLGHRQETAEQGTAEDDAGDQA